MKRVTLLLMAALVLVAATFLIAACGDEEPASEVTTEATEEPASDETTEATGEGGSGDIVDVLEEAGDFTVLLDALADAGLLETLRGEGPFTLFAPTDEAFEELSETESGAAETEAEEMAMADEDEETEEQAILRESAEEVLTYHVLPQKLMSADFDHREQLDTLNDNEVVWLLGEGDSWSIRGADLEILDIEASNGVIHVIDDVMIPGYLYGYEDDGASDDEAAD